MAAQHGIGKLASKACVAAGDERHDHRLYLLGREDESPSRQDLAATMACGLNGFAAARLSNCGRCPADAAFLPPERSPLPRSAVAHRPRALVALHCAADVMLVTPLRDGMNLAAKEFAASRVDDDGVLVLTEFAGAAAELNGAVTINPCDIDGAAEAIGRAPAMPAGEKRARMRTLRRRVLEHDVHAWVLPGTPDGAPATGQTPPPAQDRDLAGARRIRGHDGRWRRFQS